MSELLSTGFKRIGKCNRCGACCMSLPTWQSMGDTRRALIRMTDPSAEPIFKRASGGFCPHLTFKQGGTRCSIYAKRPRFCREYPNHPSHLLPECSIKLIDPTIKVDESHEGIRILRIGDKRGDSR